MPGDAREVEPSLGTSGNRRYGEGCFNPAIVGLAAITPFRDMRPATRGAHLLDHTVALIE
jgi:hypothetical protein